jgi:large subunit ribosomal protein L24
MARPIKEKSGRNPKEIRFATKLKVGDPVMVLTGGNSKKDKKLAGEVGKILRFFAKKERVVVQGLNMIKKHKRAQTARDTGGVITKEGSVHVSNVMFYSEKLKRPVRLKSQVNKDGKKVRGFIDPKSKKFEAIE